MIELRSKVGSRGQVVIPKPIREMLHITAGRDVFFRVEKNGIYIHSMEGREILEDMLNRVKDKKAEPKKVNWKKMYYSQFE